MSDGSLGWVWPWWRERQLDPTSPAHVADGDPSSPVNRTGRNWTTIGNLDSPLVATVDPRGLVTPWRDGWSVDWWIGADDRWHLPSREPSGAVTQRLVDGAPVVETSMRVPGGHAVHRAWCVRVSAGPGEPADELVVVEVENRSRVPFAVALSIRPANAQGLVAVEQIAVGEQMVTVDGRPALLLGRRPARAAASPVADGDVAATVVGGAAASALPDPVRCPAGRAQAAVVYPLAHTATLRVAVPLAPGPGARRRRPTALPVRDLTTLPPADAVARGWAAHVGRGMRVVVPDAKLAAAIAANQAALLVRHDGGEAANLGSAAEGRLGFRDGAAVVAALDRWGFHDEAAQTLGAYPGRQRTGGRFDSPGDGADATGAVLWSFAEHWRLTRDRALVGDVLASVAAGARWIARRRRASVRHRVSTLGRLLSERHERPPVVRGDPGSVVGHGERGRFGRRRASVDLRHIDDLWSVAGLGAAAELLAAADHADAGVRVRAEAAALAAALDASLAVVAARRGTVAMPAGPGGEVDAASVDGGLDACEPLRHMAADDERIAATAEVVRDRCCATPPGLGTDATPAVVAGDGAGLDPARTLALASVELAGGDRRSLDRLAWLLRAAAPTWTWPGAIHPCGTGGCTGDGHDIRTAADLLSFARALLVREVGDPTGLGTGTAAPGLALLSLVPDEWLGGDVEVHRAPTWFGTLSYAVRWHGARPALLWELDRHPDIVARVRITVPGLDPTWASTEAKGEALLAPVVPSSGLPKVAAPLAGARTPAAQAPDTGPGFV